MKSGPNGTRKITLWIPYKFMKYEHLTPGDVEREIYNYLYRRYGDTYIQSYNGKNKGDHDDKSMGNDDDTV